MLIYIIITKLEVVELENGGLIRLIVHPNEQDNTIELVYISYNHYEDFKKGKVIYYDE